VASRPASLNEIERIPSTTKIAQKTLMAWCVQTRARRIQRKTMTAIGHL
jgi:hypothetical protein